MLSTTISSYSNSVNSDSSSLKDFYGGAVSGQKNEPKKHRKKMMMTTNTRQGGNGPSQVQLFNRPDHNHNHHGFYPAQGHSHQHYVRNPLSGGGKKMVPSSKSRKSSRIDGSKHVQEVPVSKQRLNKKINRYDSSDASSNNLTCSELDTSSNHSSTNQRFQRKKFIKCVLREDIDTLKLFANQFNLLGIRDKHKNTLMHIACGFGRLKSIQFLMKVCPLLVDELDDKGHNPLDVAIKHGQIEVVKWLLPKTNRLQVESQQSNETLTQRRSCLHLAAKHGENEILKFILGEMYKNQMSLDTQDANGNTAAHLAAKYNHLACLQTLVEYNCDVTITNKNGHTPCFVAEFYANHECVHYLMIVETCINLSIKVVKMGRKLRETKTNNEILKAQMDEAIAINNDFINQRENVMNISLDLMQRQLNQLEAKIANEIEELKAENRTLTEKVRKSIKMDQLQQQQQQQQQHHQQQVNFERSASEMSSHGSNSVRLSTNKYLIENDLNQCKQELNNTKQICNKVLSMDQRKLDSVKSRFNEIKLNMENNGDLLNSKTNSSSCDSFDIVENKEHFDVLRKMYQETTHKLMVFRNMLKERQLSQKRESNNNSRTDNYYNQVPVSSNSSSSSTHSVNTYNLYQNAASPALSTMHKANNKRTYQHSSSSNEATPPISIVTPIPPTSASVSNFNDNNQHSSMSSDLSRHVSSTPSPLKEQITHVTPINDIKDIVKENFDYTSDETLSDNDYDLAQVDDDDDDCEDFDADNYDLDELENHAQQSVRKLSNVNSYDEDSDNPAAAAGGATDDESDQQSTQTIIENYNSKSSSQPVEAGLSEPHIFHKHLNDEVIIEEINEDDHEERTQHHQEEIEEINEQFTSYNYTASESYFNHVSNFKREISHPVHIGICLDSNNNNLHKPDNKFDFKPNNNNNRNGRKNVKFNQT